MRHDTRENASFEELQQEQTLHWKGVGRVRDERYQVTKDMLARPWRCPKCGNSNTCGGVCPKCREARIVEIE